MQNPEASSIFDELNLYISIYNVFWTCDGSNVPLLKSYEKNGSNLRKKLEAPCR